MWYFISLTLIMFITIFFLARSLINGKGLIAGLFKMLCLITLSGFTLYLLFIDVTFIP